MKSGAKRNLFIIIAFCVFLLTACAENENTGTAVAYTVRQIAEVTAASQTENPPFHYLSPDNEYFDEYVENFYGLDSSKIVDGAIFYAGGMEAAEIAVLQMDGQEIAFPARDTLNDYIAHRAGAFAGYAPAESAMLEDSVAVVSGELVAVIICADPDAAESDFLSCFTDDPAVLPPDGKISLVVEPIETEPPETVEPSPAVSPESVDTPEPTATSEPVETAEPSPTPEPTTPPPADTTAPSEPSPGGVIGAVVLTEKPAETETPAPEKEKPEEATPPEQIDANNLGIYDREAILMAYASNDEISLNELNSAVLNKCREIIAEVITDSMDEYEKEKAIHDYIAGHVEYDDAVHDQGPDSNPDPNNDNPYGALINSKAICYGYAYSFQLLTQMLGFDCIVIEGDSTGGEHAWDMIVVEGRWYCVDVTWDRTGSGTFNHQFFNQNSAFFQSTGHIWTQTPDMPVANESGQLLR